jgi:DNA adenine methylase
MNKKIRPIVKWTGGKYNEFTLFADKIPSFERYIEPFFGGGGVFFAIRPKGKSFINDKSTDLINFYREIKNPMLHKELLHYVTAWTELGQLHVQTWKNCHSCFIDYINGQETLDTLSEKLAYYLPIALRASKILKDPCFLIDPVGFSTMVSASMVDKAKRIRQICQKEQKTFTYNEFHSHFETGVKSGAYLFFRSMLNKNYKNTLTLTPVKAAANWYFVREFCYGSMFRYNSRGEFNIPYGGITYNKKNFKLKVESIFAKEIVSLFQETTIANQDFESFLTGIALSEKDFIFLDPPYDSEFSEYDQSAFTQSDQLRLANFLIKVPAKWMVVIKETPYIRQIYSQPKISINVFHKNYTYNVRGRNNRKVQHLIITNY